MKRLTLLRTEKIGPSLWRLTSHLKFEHEGTKYEVPAGFITDGLSAIRRMDDTGAEAAVLHDWLYSLDCTLSVTRAQADSYFLAAMRDNGAGLISSYVRWSGVKVGGWASFKKCYSLEKITDDSMYALN